jgi:protein-tyrosine phosphatase
MAESVFTYLVKKKGLEDLFEIDSAATSTEEIGNRPHYGTVSKLRAEGIPLVPHRARQMTRRDYEKFDYIIGMDSANIRNMGRLTGGDPEGKFYKMLEFAGSPADVADPWYTDNFDATYRDITIGLDGFFRFLEERGEI